MRYAALLTAAVLLAYANHFDNEFHFDDSHAIVENPYIRDLSSIPRFFTDGRTFSSLPQNQQYRPIVSTSLAIDYQLAGGLSPRMFHVSTFLWFLLQLALMYGLFLAIGERIEPRLAKGAAWFATAWYGVHPAGAETINYVIQRGEVYATLGIVAGLWLYVAQPRWRTAGLYLVPVALAQLSKEIAFVFPALLFLYLRCFEEEKATAALRRCVPASVTSLAVGVLVAMMMSSSQERGASSSYEYWMTQPSVVLRYVGALFLPIHLSADSDYTPIARLADPRFAASSLAMMALIAAWVWCMRHHSWRPVAFGLGWFLIALLPTSAVPLAEVENTHRMYLPFVGLVFAVVWTAALGVERLLPRATAKRCAAIGGACLLIAYAWGTTKRNEVWRTEESLWRDVTRKSPRNARGLMNYGVALMARGETRGALYYFDRAAAVSPSYFYLEINRAIANGELGKVAEARAHFEHAAALAPREARVSYYYGRWLLKIGDQSEAIARLQAAVRQNPGFLEAPHLLMRALAEQQRWLEVERVAMSTLGRFPQDETALGYQRRAAAAAAEIARRLQENSAQPNAGASIELSLQLYRVGRFAECIEAARQALALQPDSAEAYNNIAAGYAAMGRWDESIDAAQQALRLRPDFALARRNLAWAEQEREKARAGAL